jgi:hypothetical protein
MDPYRETPITVFKDDPPGPRWVIHSHMDLVGKTSGGLAVNACRWCRVGMPPRRAQRCFGRRRWWFGRWLCPPRAHHHVECVHCGRDWLEATCDEAKS